MCVGFIYRLMSSTSCITVKLVIFAGVIFCTISVEVVSFAGVIFLYFSNFECFPWFLNSLFCSYPTKTYSQNKLFRTILIRPCPKVHEN